MTSTLTAIPFFARVPFAEDRQQLVDLVRRIGTDPQQRFILGPYTARLEAELQTQLGAAAVVATSSGTAALTLVLSALGIRPGDEVVVPAFGCAPLASTVANLGATPVFADIDPVTMVSDPDQVARRITPQTRALMPAHMFSVMADMPRFVALAATHDVELVEDSAVAQGAELDGIPAGRWGHAGVFSFVQVKTFGTAGEGGVVVTDDLDLAARVRRLRNHGQDETTRFLHHEVGFNSRFDEILAAFQLHRLSGLSLRLQRRADIADYYHQRFVGLAQHGIQAPPPGRNGRAYYVYCVRTPHRDALRTHLARYGVGSHVYYPQPLPQQPAFAPYAQPGDCWPHATQASRDHLAIPLYPQLRDDDVQRVADAVCAFAANQPKVAP